MYPFALWDVSTRSTSATRRNALKLARQGNARAIATLMNHSLKNKGITARASLQEGCLWVVLEGNPTPRRRDMVRFVQSGISRLETLPLKIIRVYGVRTGETIPAWSEVLLLNESVNSPIGTTPAKTNGDLAPSLKQDLGLSVLEPQLDSQTAETGIAPLRVTGSAERLREIYSKEAHSKETYIKNDPPPNSTQRADAALSDLANDRSISPANVDRSSLPTVSNLHRSPLPFTAPVPSQLRLMAFLKVLTAITILVAVGSAAQVLVPLKGFPGMNDPLMLRVMGSAALLGMAIVAWIALFRRSGINLHPKYAQRAYVRLGLALLVNVGLALLLMVLFGLGVLTPTPFVILPLFAVCIGLWMMGCCTLAKAKGYSPIFGIVGILLLDGAVLLSIFPDRSPHSKGLRDEN
jgi:hypothetical protein